MAKDHSQEQLELFHKFAEEEDIETVIALQNAAVSVSRAMASIYIVKSVKDLKQLVTPMQYENTMDFMDPNVGNRPGCWLGCNLGNHMVSDYRETEIRSLVEKNAGKFVYLLTNEGTRLCRQLIQQHCDKKSSKAIVDLLNNLETQD